MLTQFAACISLYGAVMLTVLLLFFCVDFEQLLALEPGNKQAMNELKKLNMVITILIGTVFIIQQHLNCYNNNRIL